MRILRRSNTNPSVRSERPGRLWIVSELYWPEETSTGHVMTGIAEGLSGFAPTAVLCCQPTYSRRGTRAVRREMRNGVEIRRVWSTRLDKNTKVGRGLNYLSSSGSLFLATLSRVRHGDLVLVVSNPPTLPYLVAVASRLRRAPYSLVLHDIFPDLPIALNWFESTSRPAQLIRKAARWLYRGAHNIFVLGRDMAVVVRKTASLPVGDDRVAVVTNWADLDVIEYKARAGSEILARLGLRDRFVVQFAGNIGPLQDIPNVVDAMELLQRRPEIHLLVVGSGQLRTWLDDEIDQRGLTNITVIDPVPRSQASMIHRACDLAIVSLIDGMYGVSVPSRSYNFLAAGRPIVAAVDPDSEIGQLVSEERVGWVVGSGDASALASAIETAADDPLGVEEMGRKARRVAEESYSRDSIVSSMADLLRLSTSTDHG